MNIILLVLGFFSLLLTISSTAAQEEFPEQWIPRGFTNFITINKHEESSEFHCNEKKDSLLIRNYMQLAGSNWSAACAEFDSKSSTLFVHEVFVSSSSSKPIQLKNCSAKLFTPTELIFNNGQEEEVEKVPSSLRGGTIWNVFLKQNHVCQTASEAPPQKKDPSHSCSFLSKQQFESVAVKNVHVVFSQHLDVGYTDFATCVLQNYFTYIYPGTAIASLQDASYVYTTHSWTLWSFFHCEEIINQVRPPPGISFFCPPPQSIELVAGAVKRKQVVWSTDVSFDGFNEALGNDLFHYAFDFSLALEKEFFPEAFQNSSNKNTGRQNTFFQMDVPGLAGTQLHEIVDVQKVTSLYLGQNGFPLWPGALLAPAPKLFLWNSSRSLKKSPSKPVLVMLHRLGRGYGCDEIMGCTLADAIIDEKSGVALINVVTLENRPPYSAGDVKAILKQIHSDVFPKADRVFASTFNAFVDAIDSSPGGRSHLPVLESDIGDSWIRAVPSDPLKTANFMRLRREFEKCVADGGCQRFAKETMSRVFFTITGIEHNFGLPWNRDFSIAVASVIEKRQMLSEFTPGTGKSFQHRVREQNEKVQEEVLCREFVQDNDKKFDLEMKVSNKTGALISLDLIDSVTRSVVERYLDSSHPLAELVYTVFEVGSPWSKRPSPWGSPLVDLPAHGIQGEHKPRFVTSKQNSSSSSCRIEVFAQLPQSYFNNNTKRTVNKHKDEMMNVVIVFDAIKRKLNQQQKQQQQERPPPLLSSLRSSSYSYSSLFNLNISIEITNMLPSWKNGIYGSFGETVDLAPALSVRFDPLVSSRSEKRFFELESLNQRYSPYKFFAQNFTSSQAAKGNGGIGICQYHLIDKAHVMLKNQEEEKRGGGEEEREVVTIETLDAPLALFGSNSNLTFNSRKKPTCDQENCFCTPRDEDGIFFNLYNQLNANWISSVPFLVDDVFNFNFKLDFFPTRI